MYAYYQIGERFSIFSVISRRLIDLHSMMAYERFLYRRPLPTTPWYGHIDPFPCNGEELRTAPAARGISPRQTPSPLGAWSRAARRRCARACMPLRIGPKRGLADHEKTEQLANACSYVFRAVGK